MLLQLLVAGQVQREAEHGDADNEEEARGEEGTEPPGADPRLVAVVDWKTEKKNLINK